MLKRVCTTFIVKRNYNPFNLVAFRHFCDDKPKLGRTGGKGNHSFRVYICGPHSTGKTTLVNDLKHHLKDFKVVQEVARRKIESRGWSHDDYDPEKHPAVFKHLCEDILSQQINIDKKCEQSGQFFIVDRACLDTIIYIGYYLGKMDKQSAYRMPGVDDCIKMLKRSLVVLEYPQAECINEDILRLDSCLEELIHFYCAFEQEYHYNDIPFIKLTHLDRQKRVNIVLSEIISGFTKGQVGGDGE